MEEGIHGDEPAEADRARLRRALLQAVAVGAVGAVGAAGAAKAASAASAAAGKGAAAAAATKGAIVAKGAAGAIATVSASATVTGKLLATIALVGVIGGGVAVGRSMSEDAPVKAPQAAVAPAGVEGDPAKGAASRLAQAITTGGEENAKGAGEPEIIAPLGEASKPADPAKIDNNAAEGGGSHETLEAETRLLQHVRVALQAGQPEVALSLLDNAFAPNKGELREERAAARIDALCRLGRTKEAEAASGRFLRESPRSPHVDRVRGACSKSPGSGGSAAPASGAPAGAPSAPAAESTASPERPPVDTTPPIGNDTSPPFSGDIIE
jgi:hypothetical protein